MNYLYKNLMPVQVRLNWLETKCAIAVFLFTCCIFAAPVFSSVSADEPDREIVPPSEIPGIEALDLDQLSFQVRIGSLAIRRNVPHMQWPPMVGQEFQRLASESEGGPWYVEECIFISDAGAHPGVQRKLIDGEVIWMGQYRVPETADVPCSLSVDGDKPQQCHRMQALSESSGMCSDTFDVDRPGAFALVPGSSGADVFYLDGEGLYHRPLEIRKGCPDFARPATRIADVSAETNALLARKDDEGVVHLLWPDRADGQGAASITSARYSVSDRVRIGDVWPLSESASPDYLNLLSTSGGLVATWRDLRFSEPHGLGSKNQSKILYRRLKPSSRLQNDPLALNAPNDANDVAFQIISSVANGYPWFAWSDGWHDSQSSSDLRTATLTSLETALISTRQERDAGQLRDRIIEDLQCHHRALGRGENGPLPQVDCRRRSMDARLRVLVPDRGFVGDEDIREDEPEC